MQQELHRLTRNQLHVNDSLPWDVYDNGGHLLLRKGFVIQRDTQIDMLLDRGMFVNAVEFKALAEGPPELQQRRAYDPLSVWQGIQGHLGTLLKEQPRDGQFQEEVRKLAHLVIELCGKHPDMALAAVMLKEYKRYPVAHSLHVAAYAELIARRSGFDDAECMSLICAALTQNIAMADLQQMLTHQRTPLTDQQRAAIDAHPLHGVRMLQNCGVDDELWLRAIAEHHEEEGGTGYPNKITRPGKAAMLLHTCDLYTAMLSSRADRKPLPATEAAKLIYVRMGQGKDNPFPGLLIKEVGMYPPGTFVKLADGEVGVVYKRGENVGTPIVAALINAKGLPQMDATLRDTSSAPQFKIVAVMPRETMIAVNFEQLWCRRH